MSELSMLELDAQHSELLPAREALSRGGITIAIGSGNWTAVSSKAIAIQALTAKSHNSASSTVIVANGALVAFPYFD
jgi:VCBS repeat-containing protein